MVIDTWRGLPVVSTPSLPGLVSPSLGERLGISQSTVPVLEEPIRVTLPVDDLDFAGVGRGVDQSGQENEGNSESAGEDHFVETGARRRATILGHFYSCRWKPLIDQMVPAGAKKETG